MLVFGGPRPEKCPSARTGSPQPRRPRPRACARRPWRRLARAQPSRPGRAAGPCGRASRGSPAPGRAAAGASGAASPRLQRPHRPGGASAAPGPRARGGGSRPRLRPGRSGPRSRLTRPGRDSRQWRVVGPGFPGVEASPRRPNRRRLAAHPAGRPRPHLSVLGFLLQGSLLQPVHRVRGGGGEAVPAQAAPLLHLGAVVGGAVAHAWGGGEGVKPQIQPARPLLRRGPKPRPASSRTPTPALDLPGALGPGAASPASSPGPGEVCSPRGRPLPALSPTPGGSFFFLSLLQQPLISSSPPHSPGESNGRSLRVFLNRGMKHVKLDAQVIPVLTRG